MNRPNWYKPYRRRSLYRRWRSWRYTGRWLAVMAVLLSIGQFYTEGAVTWPDSMMRKADGYVRSIFQELPSFEKNEPQEPPRSGRTNSTQASPSPPPSYPSASQLRKLLRQPLTSPMALLSIV